MGSRQLLVSTLLPLTRGRIPLIRSSYPSMRLFSQQLRRDDEHAKAKGGNKQGQANTPKGNGWQQSEGGGGTEGAAAAPRVVSTPINDKGMIISPVDGLKGPANRWAGPKGAGTSSTASAASIKPNTSSSPSSAAPGGGIQSQQQKNGKMGVNGGGAGGASRASDFRKQQGMASQQSQSLLGSSTRAAVEGGGGGQPQQNGMPRHPQHHKPHGTGDPRKAMDMATFNRFANVNERVKNKQSQKQQQQQQQQQTEAGGGGGGQRINGHRHPNHQRQAGGPNLSEQQQKPHQQSMTAGGAAAAAAASVAGPTIAAGAEGVILNRWALNEKSRHQRWKQRRQQPTDDQGRVKMWQDDGDIWTKRNGQVGGKQQQQQPRKKVNRMKLDRRLRALKKVPLILPHEPISMRELSSRLSLKMDTVIKRLVALGMDRRTTTPDSKVDLDYAELLGLELRRKVKRMEPKENLLEYKSMSRESRPDWPLRAPVVCVMGHVDHGKTTLLDALRKTKVAEGEAGGITQRLGAFHIAGLSPSSSSSSSSSPAAEQKQEELGVTFLDTPGHAAFSAMRLNGACATDIILLVVSATDGIQEQTKEVLELVAKEPVSLMVAVTKVDKLGSPDEVKEAMQKIEQQLASHGVMTESLGGEVQMVPISAVKGEGLEDLTERLMLQAEVLELRADRQAPGEGLVLDCHVDKGLGQVLTVLMRWGALQPGDYVVAGEQYTRIKKIMDDKGQSLEQGLPSMPVRVLGFKELPAPGEGLIVVKSEERAKAVAEARRTANENQRLEEAEIVEMMYDDEKEQLADIMQNHVGGNVAKKTKAFLAMQQGQLEGVGPSPGLAQKRGPVIVPFLVKSDGKGTLDAVTASIGAYHSDIIRAEVVGAGCGPITMGDIERAKAAGEGIAGQACTILAFNVGYASADISESARRDGLEVKKQSVIYSLLDDVKEVLQARMPMERIETSVGRLEVQATFSLTGRRKTRNTVAGCKVVHGQAFSSPTYRYRVMRGEQVLCDESVPTTLYHFKEQVQEVNKGMECGLSLEAFGDFQPRDVIECYTVAEKPKSLKELFRF